MIVQTESVDESVLLVSRRSEGEPSYNLNIPRGGHIAIPHAERWIAHTVAEGSGAKALSRAIERVPVPDVEKLTAQLQIEALGDSDVLDQSHVMVVVPEAPQV